MLVRNIIRKAYMALSYIYNNIAISLCLFLIALNAHANMQTALLDSNIVAPTNKYQDNLITALNSSSLNLKTEVNQLYQLRDYNLIWSNGEEYNQNAHALYEVIRTADEFGLSPDDYDAEMIAYFLESRIEDPNIISKSDITFTHAYVKLASHIESGKYFVSDTITDEQDLLIEILNDAVNGNAVTIALESLHPSTTNYTNIVTALKKYRRLLHIDEEFNPIKLEKKSLAIGSKSTEIIKLRKRLHALGDYNSDDLGNEEVDLQSDILDESLALAISKFQMRHGLEADGLLGRKTAKEINTPIAYRIRQLELNLERARQLPELNEGQHLVVNIPDYSLYLVNDGKKIYTSRVVVGKTKHKTPVLTSELTQLVLNPYWNVPKSISNNEILPKLLLDPDYLSRNDMKVLSTLNNQNQVINPETIDWSNIDFYNAALRIRQDPGAKNSLGKVKFIFPNNYSVYLHDTPARKLFARNERAFSHGCIRLEDPVGLAEILLSTNNQASGNIESLIQRKRRKTLKFVQPIPIHITYMTAWVNEHGVANFRPDIYKRDSQITNNLYNAAQ